MLLDWSLLLGVRHQLQLSPHSAQGFEVVQVHSYAYSLLQLVHGSQENWDQYLLPEESL